jgi:phosphate:Na+ symporter
MLLQILTLIGALGMFLFGMTMMSSGIQKAAGEKMRSFLSWMTSNPFKGVLTGLGITSVIQSSSATTVMVVSFVNAGLLSLSQAVGVIMGANIGTTVTSWIVSIFGFKFDISMFSFPLMALGFILSISKKSKTKNIGEFIIGFALLFLGLAYMKENVPDLNSHPEIFSFISRWTGYGFGSVLIFLLFGTVLTLILQSSSATVALTLIMVNMGWIPFEMGAAMVLGENIGTTITANLAAAVANVQAKRAALAHTLFNVFGVMWVLVIFKPFLRFIGWLITLLGYPDPMNLTFTGGTMDPASGTSLLYGISMLHTMFNLINTLILIWFTDVIVKIVTTIIKDPVKKKDDNFQLRYISAGRMSTPAISLEQAFKEVINFALTSKEGFQYVKLAVNVKSWDDFEQYRIKLVEYEEIADKFEFEIAAFLNGVTTEEISGEEAEEVKVMYRVIGELESLGDSCENISRLLDRLRVHGQKFEESTTSKINLMIYKVNEAYTVMVSNLKAADEGTLFKIDNAYAAEDNINETRDTLRDEGIQMIEKQSGNYQTANYFLDLVSELEAMGDFIINVSQVVVRESAD